MGEEKRLTDSVLENIIIPQDPPYMVLILGPCRVGTTALSNVFARAGCEAYMQPIKSMRRALENQEKVVAWNIASGQSFVVSKETLGVKTEAEFFNPLETLLQAGYPPERLHLIPIVREPETALASWIRMWGEVFSIQRFTQAYQMTAAIKDLAQVTGIAVTPYVHEAIRANEPKTVVEKLFARIHTNSLGFSRNLVDWSNGVIFGEPGSNIVFFDNPPPPFIEGVKEWGGYVYRELTPTLDQAQVDALKASGINKVYDTFVRECEQVLSLTI
jgi:hypothetical protein